MFQCQRRTTLNSECKFCCRVFKWSGDTNNQLIFSKCYTDFFWDTHSEQVFVQNTYLKENLQIKRCAYF